MTTCACSWRPKAATSTGWEIKAQGNRDITEPGDTEWRGFADVIDAYRNGGNKIEVLENGPALVRVRCTNEGGLEKTITVWAGVPWVEVSFNRPVERFWCYDDAKVMGPDSPTPGTYLFSDGDTGPVKGGKSKSGVQWGSKFVESGILEAVLTPEEKPTHIVGPGGGTGGVGHGGWKCRPLRYLRWTLLRSAEGSLGSASRVARLPRSAQCQSLRLPDKVARTPPVHGRNAYSNGRGSVLAHSLRCIPDSYDTQKAQNLPTVS